jgi:two-component system sensor histidine kinase/response regulator
MKSYASDYTILVVDGVPTNIMLVQVILKKEGYTILKAESGAQAIQIARERKPHIILLDMIMPDMEGLEVLRQLKSSPETNHIPVIIMSALDDMVTILKGYKAGATEYVTKPFQKEELIKRIAHRFQLYTVERMRQELEASMESHDMMYAIISHDLRSPLGSLKMMNNSILRMVDKETVGEAAYEMLLTMNKISEETFQLLDNLTKWSKYTQDKILPYRQRTDINSIIESIISVYKPIAELKRVTISLQDEGRLYGNIDIDMLKTIIRNLLSNAINYSYEGGTVSLSAEVDKEDMIFRIKDSGIGIKEIDKDALFSPSFYTSLNNKGHHHSAGFGVFIAKSFVELHGGAIRFESEEGKGTTFFFSLPINEE